MFQWIRREYYITSAGWVSENHQISVVWMSRAQNSSIISTCFSPKWLCIEVRANEWQGKQEKSHKIKHCSVKVVQKWIIFFPFILSNNLSKWIFQQNSNFLIPHKYPKVIKFWIFILWTLIIFYHLESINVVGTFITVFESFNFGDPGCLCYPDEHEKSIFVVFGFFG